VSFFLTTEERRKLPSSCTIERRWLSRREVLNLGTGVSAPLDEEWVTGPCDAPLFGDEGRQLGACSSCAKGWTHEHNAPTEKGLAQLAALGSRKGAGHE
jgi:hypothetical protein